MLSRPALQGTNLVRGAGHASSSEPPSSGSNQQLAGVLCQCCLINPCGPPGSAVETVSVTQQSITAFPFLTATRWGRFIITVNAVVAFIVDISFLVYSSVNSLFLLTVCCSTFCSAAQICVQFLFGYNHSSY